MANERYSKYASWVVSAEKPIQLMKRYGIPTREIAEAMGIPKSSVNSIKREWGLYPTRKKRTA
jgi:hypothetical protein